MILRELFYFDQISTQPGEQKQYDPSEDQSIMQMGDTRKTRLSLKQINKALKKPELYTDDELHHLKKKRREFLDVERRSNLEQRGGFGV